MKTITLYDWNNKPYKFTMEQLNAHKDYFGTYHKKIVGNDKDGNQHTLFIRTTKKNKEAADAAAMANFIRRIAKGNIGATD
jgi:hypothetical protein